MTDVKAAENRAQGMDTSRFEANTFGIVFWNPLLREPSSGDIARVEGIIEEFNMTPAPRAALPDVNQVAR